jgi:hypothetical protein
MKKAMPRPKKKGKTSSQQVDRDDILPEYDFSRGRPNPYAQRYGASPNVVELDPDVAAVFPDARAVNQALRALVGIIQQHGSKAPRQSRKSRSTGSAAPR